MLAVTRFRVPPPDEAAFVGLARAASDFYATCAGNEGCDLVRNLDAPELWALVTRWADVGSYRRAFSGYEAKVILTPLLLLALDEPGAYEAPDALGPNLPRGA